jgi:4-amino-4-deoxy-L-arabinose transferase-like glycosyltransferase
MAVGVLLLTQTLFFILLLHRPLAVEGDADRYEQGGWNLAEGRGYSLPLHGYGGTNDLEIYSWVCSRHPEACLEDTTHPVAIYLPGYSVFVAGVYRLFGRSLLALCLSQLVLLWGAFVMFEQLAARLLSRTAYVSAVAIAATYPFLAQQATRLMSDHLHAVLWVSAFAAFACMRAGIWRGAVFGALIAGATLVRPYGLLVFPVLWLVSLVWKPMRLATAEWGAGAIAFALPFSIWTARNEYWYGRFLPMTTGGAGALLYQSTLEWDVDLSKYENGRRWYEETASKYGDIVSRRGSQLQTEEALMRIHAHPWKFAERVLIHVPRLWISMASRYWPVSVVYLGGLLVLGLWGAWTVRRDARFYPLLFGIGLYWLFLLPLPGEARRTLPLRLPMLLLAGMAAGEILERRSRPAAGDLV